jgi:O6-methylguanine-DNA--protein-cysteine methyltransferase
MSSLFKVCLAAAAIFALPAHADTPPQQGTPSDCKGLSAGSADLPTMIQKRQDMQKQMCGNDGRLVKRLKTIQDHLSACKDLGKDLNGNSHSIPADAMIPSLSNRLVAACNGQQDYITASQKLCQQYGATAAKSESFAAGVKAGPTNGQAKPVRDLQNNVAGVGRDYASYQSEAAAQQKKLTDKFSDIKDSKDQLLARNVGAMKGSINSFVTYMEDQARRKLTDRQKAAAKNDENAETMRWKTQADVQKFYQNLDKCKAVIRQGGPLDIYVKEYDLTLSKSLDLAKSESGTLSTKFQSLSSTSLGEAKTLGDTATSLESTTAATQAAASNPVLGGDLDKRSAEARGNELTAGVSGARDYASYNTEAQSCFPTNPSCYHLDGMSSTDPTAQCFKKAGGERVCLHKP